MTNERKQQFPNIWMQVKDGKVKWDARCPNRGCSSEYTDWNAQGECVFRGQFNHCLCSAAVNDAFRNLAERARRRVR